MARDFRDSPDSGPVADVEPAPIVAQGFSVECTTGGRDCACNTHQERYCANCEFPIVDGQMIRPKGDEFVHVDCAGAIW